MPTKRIGDLPTARPCDHPEHRPPSQIYLEPGIYEHTCPGCGNSFTFVVPPGPRWFVDKIPARGPRSKRAEQLVLVTPHGSSWPIDWNDAPLAEWAVDILNAGEVK